MTQPSAADPYRGGGEHAFQVIVTTGNDVAGYVIAEYVGVVRGIVVRSPNIGQSFVGAFKQIVGGNISQYVDVCEAARRDAFVQMVQHAQAIGAHAIVAMRYDATEFVQGATEVLCYGTAVRLQRA
ncbi:MAG TPA: YbjQ family protein [Polyangiaceae bacterium]|nr:YbjQ family protein [Polyangiaceae bacterium]